MAPPGLDLPLAAVLAMWLTLAPIPVRAQSEVPTTAADGLAMKLQNPVANLISVPIENNWEFSEGPAHATDYFGNVKPVIPFPLGTDWNLITRTIVPFSYSVLLDRGLNGRAGVGDVVATVYLSPGQPIHGWFWGIGPGLVVPTATDDLLGSGKWSAGPTGAVVAQFGPWSVLTLVGQTSSFAGDPMRGNVETTYLQPSLSYTTQTDTSIGLDTQSSYDWTAGVWVVPLEVSASQVFTLAGQEMSLGLTVRSHLDRPVFGPRWGLAFTATFLFPR
jgi:hypothetical protein